MFNFLLIVPACQKILSKWKDKLWDFIEGLAGKNACSSCMWI